MSSLEAVSSDHPPLLRGRSPAVVVAGVALIALIFVGSVAMWLGVPLGWLWIGSHLARTTGPSAGPYAVVAVGIGVSIIAFAAVLRWLDTVFSRLTGHEPKPRRTHAPWHQSVSAERVPWRQRSVLDVVLPISIGIAFVVGALWFYFFSGSPIPQ